MASALRVGLPFGFFIGPFMPLNRAQKDLLRGPPPGCGALRFEPVALLYFALPAAVSPPFRLLWLPIRKLTFFAIAITKFKSSWTRFHLIVLMRHIIPVACNS